MPRDTRDMGVSGVVRVWHPDAGWGVIDSQHTPGGCWAHFSSVVVAGYKALSAGQAVTLNYESAEQDGYSFRAIEVWPADQQPDRAESEPTGASDAYHSRLTINAVDPTRPDSA